jgi:hypothetical protein
MSPRYAPTTNPNEFWNAAGPPGCWEWQGARTAKGYGVTSTKRAWSRAHRKAWILLNGPIPAGMFVLHRCNNPPCVRPDHLYLGTQSDNMIDRAAKTRPYPKNWQLSEADVADIRARYATGTIRQRDLGAEYGIKQDAVSRIVLGKSYRFDKHYQSNRKRKEVTDA